MSSVAFNLTRKLEWMGRRLRKLDDVREITEWVNSMTAINCLLKEVDIKPCSDNWRPWSKIENGVKNDLRNTALGRIASRKPNKQYGCEGKKWKLSREDNAKQEKKTDTKIKPIAWRGLPPRVQLAEDDTEMALNEIGSLAQKKDLGYSTEDTMVPNSMPKKENVVREVWRNALLEIWSKDRFKGCTYFGRPNIAEWHPNEELLRDIARKLNRDYETEMTDNLKQFLTTVTIRYYKDPR